jgi:hypothetical protein
MDETVFYMNKIKVILKNRTGLLSIEARNFSIDFHSGIISTKFDWAPFTNPTGLLYYS